VLSVRGLYDELITRPEESYRLWCVVVCDLETSRMSRPWPALGRNATEKKNIWFYVLFTLVSYVFLLLCLCIPIVMYAPFSIFCFHCAKLHSSATLTEDFPCFFLLSFKANAKV